MNDRETIEANLLEIRSRIEQAASRVGRSGTEVTLLAVSKLQPITKLLAYQEICVMRREQALYGENYVQEARGKRDQLPPPFCLHLIGPLQRNKARDAVRIFDVIQSVHSESIALAIQKEAEKQDKIQDIMLQVNISDDSAKNGFEAQELATFIMNTLSRLDHIRCVGLMTITRLYDTAEEARSDFKRMRELRDSISGEILTAVLKQTKPLELSMGMSDDFEVAIEEGATMVRIGTALFGVRPERKVSI